MLPTAYVLLGVSRETPKLVGYRQKRASKRAAEALLLGSAVPALSWPGWHHKTRQLLAAVSELGGEPTWAQLHAWRQSVGIAEDMLRNMVAYLETKHEVTLTNGRVQAHPWLIRKVTGGGFILRLKSGGVLSHSSRKGYHFGGDRKAFAVWAEPLLASKAYQEMVSRRL